MSNCSTCAGSAASTVSYTIGDTRPAGVIVIPSDAHAVASATYAVVDSNDNAITNGNCTVAVAPQLPDTASPYTVPPISTIKTPLITWSGVGEFTVRYAITWDDGVIDNSVTQTVEVVAVAG